jgi:hypothetical protein
MRFSFAKAMALAKTAQKIYSHFCGSIAPRSRARRDFYSFGNRSVNLVDFPGT